MATTVTTNRNDKRQAEPFVVSFVAFV